MFRVLVVLMLMPIASAQVTYDLQLEAGAPEAPIRPEEPVPVHLNWTLSCEPGGTEMIAVDPGTLQFNVSSPPGIVVRGKTTVIVQPPDCTGSPTNGTTTLRLTATSDAPGLQPLTATIAGNLNLDTVVPTTLEDDASIGFEVAYIGRVEAKLPVALQEGVPGTTSIYTITLTNFGNAPSRMIMTSDNDGFTVPEAPVVAAGETTNVTVSYHHPDSRGYANHETSGLITITPVAEETAEEGPSVLVNMLARTRSDLLAPGPGPWIAIALVATAWVARRIA